MTILDLDRAKICQNQVEMCLRCIKGLFKQNANAKGKCMEGTQYGMHK